MNVALQRLMEKCPDAKVYGTSWFAYDELGQIREAGPTVGGTPARWKLR